MPEPEAANLDLVRRHYHAYNDGDLDRIVETLDPEVEIVTADERAVRAAGERHLGRAQARRFFAEIQRLVADSLVEVLGLDAEADRVVASVRLHGSLRGGERSGSIPAIHNFVVRDGLIARIETYRPDWRQEAEAPGS